MCFYIYIYIYIYIYSQVINIHTAVNSLMCYDCFMLCDNTTVSECEPSKTFCVKHKAGGVIKKGKTKLCLFIITYNTHIRAHTHTYTRANISAHTQIHTPTHTRPPTLTYPPTHTRAHKHTHIHTHTHSLTHTHTQTTHTHTINQHTLPNRILQNYHQISKLSTLSKTLERVVAIQLRQPHKYNILNIF